MSLLFESELRGDDNKLAMSETKKWMNPWRAGSGQSVRPSAGEGLVVDPWLVVVSSLCGRR